MACLAALAAGIMGGVDPAICIARALVSGSIGWVAGALWAVMLTRPPEPTVDKKEPEVGQE
ncbi:MAG: hypothetical protein HUU60_08545 [Armatimonadetes bacterium]|nr:hypothetical protein [Armatimonadota bacterium]